MRLPDASWNSVIQLVVDLDAGQAQRGVLDAEELLVPEAGRRSGT